MYNVYFVRLCKARLCKIGRRTQNEENQETDGDPAGFISAGGQGSVKEYCEEAIFYDTEPKDDREIIERIGDSDAVFVSYNRTIGENILSACPNLQYIGMCCSLYSAASSNVDITYAEEHGIRVTGIRDYGDEGVAEYVIAELIRRLHGTDGNPPLLGEISEISGIKAGFLGMGASARAVAKGLTAFGADIRYYSRTSA